MFGKTKKQKAEKAIFLLIRTGSSPAVINKIAALIAKFDIDIDTQISGVSLLHACIRYERLHIFDYLISEGANINIKNSKGKTPLIAATEKKLTLYVNILLTKDALTDARAGNESTALIFAACNNSIDILRLLLDTNTDIEIKGRSGGTALAWATFSNNYEATKILLEYGANIYTKNNDNLDSSYYGKKSSNKDIKALIEKEIIRISERVKLGNVKEPENRWAVIGDQAISHIEYKAEINRTITEIFNFQAETLITIIENNETHAETMVKEPLNVANGFSISTACQKYKDITGKEIMMSNREKQVQSWNNLNKNN